jgi:hypothetical protein
VPTAAAGTVGGLRRLRISSVGLRVRSRRRPAPRRLSAAFVAAMAPSRSTRIAAESG